MAPSAKRKLIEVALPLDAISRESAREKSIRHGHPSTLHLWWARRPLAACRAVLFATLVNDPSAEPGRYPTEAEQARARAELLGVLERLSTWEGANDAATLRAARAVLREQGAAGVTVLDPFAGGGSIPLEAQRLGLRAVGSDLNPVAVLIGKGLIEVPSRFAGRAAVHPAARAEHGAHADRPGAGGLAEDVRRYGADVAARAHERLGHLYPPVRDDGGAARPVVAWLWARTVRCPNPACRGEMPLVRSFALSTRPTARAWVQPLVDTARRAVAYAVHTGDGGPPDGTVDRRGARCLICGASVPLSHVRAEGRAKRMGARLMAIVGEGERGRVWRAPTEDDERLARSATPGWRPDVELPANPRDFKTPGYGLTTFAELFSDRQLVALDTLADLVRDARAAVAADARAAGLPPSGSLEDGCDGADAYADAIAMYLAFALDRVVDRHTTICTWDSSPTKLQLRNTFARQAIPMTWDFAEGNPLGMSSGAWSPSVEWVARAVDGLPASPPALVWHLDAAGAARALDRAVVATDPPYYDNIGYADLSDLFYVWLRRTLGDVFPRTCGTLRTPKAEELVASPYRFGGDRDAAKGHFEGGLTEVFGRIRDAHHPDYPFTVFYAFRQMEGAAGQGDTSTGWETMLEALLGAGFGVTATWPLRSELGHRMLASGRNALASSIVLACRPRPADAPLATRRELVEALRAELPGALKALQHANIAPVDLAQASIGPGIAVFSRFGRVVEADGRAMPVRTALSLINQMLDRLLAEQEADLDPATRWAVAWFEQHGMKSGPYGVAETLATAKNAAVGGLVRAGIVAARGGRVRLRDRAELTDGRDPGSGLTAWELVQRLVDVLETEGEQAAAALLNRAGAAGEAARELAYRLYATCERRGWAAEARAYNALVVAWPELARLAAGAPA